MFFIEGRCLPLEAKCAYVYCRPRDFRSLHWLIVSFQWKSHFPPRRSLPPQRKSSSIMRPELLRLDLLFFLKPEQSKQHKWSEHAQYWPCISCLIETLLMKILSALFADVLLHSNVTCTVADISMKAAGDLLVPPISVESGQEYQLWRFSDHLRL